MKKKYGLFFIISVVMTLSFNSCIFISDEDEDTTPTIDCSIENATGYTFKLYRPDAVNFIIVFENNYAIDLASSYTNDGKLSAGKYERTGVNSALISYTWKPNDGVSKQHKATLTYTTTSGGTVKFDDLTSTGTFSFRK